VRISGARGRVAQWCRGERDGSCQRFGQIRSIARRLVATERSGGQMRLPECVTRCALHFSRMLSKREETSCMPCGLRARCYLPIERDAKLEEARVYERDARDRGY